MPHTITVERDSVCMGDDVTAPNTATVSVNDEMHLSATLSLIAEIMPNISDDNTIVWSVHTNEKNGKPLGMFEIDDKKLSGVTLFVLDKPMKELGVKKVYCRYFHSHSFSMYSECPTLGLKVMKHLNVCGKK